MAPPRSRRGPVVGRTRCSPWRAVALGALAALLVLLAGCGEQAAPAAPATTTEPLRQLPRPVDGELRAHVPAEVDPPDTVEAEEVLLFGDSVAVLFADELAEGVAAPLTVDAVDCRRLDAGFTGPCGGVPTGAGIAPGLDDLVAQAGALDRPERSVAVVVIANNAALRVEDLDAAMDEMADVHRVWWVTARVQGPAWQDPNNRLLAELAERHPNAGVVDWFTVSADQPWLADGVHPNEEGQAALAGLVADHITCDCSP